MVNTLEGVWKDWNWGQGFWNTLIFLGILLESIRHSNSKPKHENDDTGNNKDRINKQKYCYYELKLFFVDTS